MWSIIMLGRWSGFILLVAGIVVATAYQITRMGQMEPLADARYAIDRTIKYSLTIKNPSNRPVKQATFWIYTPLQQGVYQILDHIESTHPYRMERDESGNQRMVFTVEHLPPFGQKRYTVTARLRLSEQPNSMSAIKPQDYLTEESFIELSEPEIKQLAQRLSEKSDQRVLKKIFHWVTANIENVGYISREQGALQTLKSKTGDCTNTMYLFSALSRANGIPTRNMAGFTTKENALLKPRDYHNWLEVFVDGQWQLIDPDKEIFMEHAADYIAMTVLKDTPTKESQLSQRLFGGSENIEITMN
jgi:transglutaminase-like putative cysteine protease